MKGEEFVNSDNRNESRIEVNGKIEFRADLEVADALAEDTELSIKRNDTGDKSMTKFHTTKRDAIDANSWSKVLIFLISRLALSSSAEDKNQRLNG